MTAWPVFLDSHSVVYGEPSGLRITSNIYIPVNLYPRSPSYFNEPIEPPIELLTTNRHFHRVEWVLHDKV